MNGPTTTPVRALEIYRRHTQANAIDFIDYVLEKFPFRIRTDRGHEFQALPTGTWLTWAWSTSTSNPARRSSMARSRDPTELSNNFHLL
jgi:hypothetical protein